MTHEDDGSSFLSRAAESLEGLSRNTGCFFLSLCALRALARPYAGLTHDASLYAVQTMNRVTAGFFSEDLFFLYGSQDEYSLFSLLVGPLAAKLGPAGAFFLAHVAFVRSVIDRQPKDAGSANVVYWPTDGNHIWFGLPAVSYYCWKQAAGAVFNRQTACEGDRRSALVKPFEIATMREANQSGAYWVRELAFYQSDLDAPAPTKQDLTALCQEESLDFIVLRQRFDRLYLDSNGEVFVYDCRSLRQAFSASTYRAITGRNVPRSIGLVR